MCGWWADYAARTKKMRNAYESFKENPEGSKLVGRTGRRQDNIKIDLIQIGYGN
jgi:hypothetical protein